jgi:AraC family transcriptional regulator of adaptative response/methylated-DNA-[protein]-cysteine methyltransferase
MITEETLAKEYYQALIDRDPHYLGSFFVGVKTTGIFCISTCRARKPKYENVSFYESVLEALQSGFRPCKVCHPVSINSATPAWIEDLISRVSASPEKKIKDQDLRTLGLAPEKVRRWFQSNYNVTFHAYQRMIRLNTAYDLIQQGEKVTRAAFESGYESLSGFGYSFKNEFDQNPEDSEGLQSLFLFRFDTKLGPMYAGAVEDGLCLLEFTGRRMLEREIEDLTKRLKARVVIGKNQHIDNTIVQLGEYFDGSREQFDLKLLTPGSDFQVSVWRLLQTIPYGETRSYKQQSITLGNPEAIRAVATANGMNRIAIVIPCHRVIGSDGSLTGYAGGLPRKKWLLAHESKQQSIDFD